MMELFTCSAQLSRFAPRVFEVLALLDITDVRPLLDASANNDNWKSLTDAMFFVEGKNVVDVYAQSSLKAPAFHARSAEMAPKSVEATHSSAVAFPPAVVDSARLSSGPTASAVPTADFPRPAPRRSLEFGQHLSLTTSETPIPTAPLLLASPVVPSALPSTSPQRAAACWAKRPPQVWLGHNFFTPPLHWGGIGIFGGRPKGVSKPREVVKTIVIPRSPVGHPDVFLLTDVDKMEEFKQRSGCTVAKKRQHMGCDCRRRGHFLLSCPAREVGFVDAIYFLFEKRQG